MRRVVPLTAALAAGCLGLALASTGAVARAQCLGETLAQMPLLEAGGRSAVPVRLNGAPFALIVDTGATHTALAAGAARQLDLGRQHLQRAILAGIGGATAADLADLQDLDLAGLHLRAFNVPVISVPMPFADGLTTAGVLGASVLSRFDVELDFIDGTMRLRLPAGCGPLNPPWPAGWSRLRLATEPGNLEQVLRHMDVVSSGTAADAYRGLPYPDHARIFATVWINERPMAAVVDTGASISALTPDAAARAAVPASGPVLFVTGIDGRPVRGRRVIAARVRIGADDRTDVQIGVADIDIGSADMVLGRDLMLNRRVLLAYESREMLWQAGATGR